jgi:serine phosphatase RsbU (regulator of sigma subunit)
MLSERILNLGIMLGAVEEAPPLDAAEVVAAQLTDVLGAEHVALLIATLSGGPLVRLSHVAGNAATAGHNERREGMAATTPAHEEALLSQALMVNPDGDNWTVLVPVSERGDAIGLLEVSLADKPDPETCQYLVAAAHALAYVLIAVRRHTDLFEWAQRDTPFSVSAELQRRLLPSAYTAEVGPATVAGWLEPSSTAGGDTFDYSLDREYLYFSLTDAMGHSLQAAQLATLAVGTFRNRRRVLATPAEQAQAADAELGANTTPEQFVTGLIARLCLADGTLEIVDAGHPAPYLVRSRHAEALTVSTHPPLGTELGPYRADTINLQAGDRLVMVTDGYLERRAALVDIETILAAGAERHPRQVVQELATNVLALTGGRLHDDATVLCVDYYGPEGQRHATGGASQDRSTRL